MMAYTPRSGVVEVADISKDIYWRGKMSYQMKTGPLMAKMSEGYCGQDAYTDMFITDDPLNGGGERR